MLHIEEPKLYIILMLVSTTVKRYVKPYATTQDVILHPHLTHAHKTIWLSSLYDCPFNLWQHKFNIGWRKSWSTKYLYAPLSFILQGPDVRDVFIQVIFDREFFYIKNTMCVAYTCLLWMCVQGVLCM